MISLVDVLNAMTQLGPDNRPKPFDMIVTRWDNKKEEGGTPIYYRQARLKTNDRKHSAKASSAQASHTAVLKNPNHSENQTRNIITAEGETRTISIRNITHFNGNQVTW